MVMGLFNVFCSVEGEQIMRSDGEFFRVSNSKSQHSKVLSARDGTEGRKIKLLDSRAMRNL